MVTDQSKRVSGVGTGCLAKPALQVLYNFQGVFLKLSVQNFFQEYCFACRSSAFYRSSGALKRAFEISSKSEFLRLVNLSLKALTYFPRTFSFVDHYGTYIGFGENGGGTPLAYFNQFTPHFCNRFVQLFFCCSATYEVCPLLFILLNF